MSRTSEFFDKVKRGQWFTRTVADAESPITEPIQKVAADTGMRTPEANYYWSQGASQSSVYAIYDGETTLGEMGAPKQYVKDFYSLRIRSKQMFLESEICQTAITRYTAWVIGNGLKLYAEPDTEVLKTEGITVDPQVFSKAMNGRWKMYAASKASDYNGQRNLPALMEEAHMEGKAGGDMLVVLRVINGLVRVQHIDAQHVCNPPECDVRYTDNPDGSSVDYIYTPTKNRIRHGVEFDETGQDVAYHVCVGVNKFQRVKARDSNGMLRAYMYYGFKPELDSKRGTPRLAVVLESAKKLQRYNSAVLAGAEERAKIPYVFEHGVNSDNEDPLASRRVKGLIAQPTPAAAAASDLAIDALGNKIANDFAVSTNKTVINLPNDTQVKSLESKQEVRVQEFSNFHIDLICAAINIPPNVALSKYEDSFSASRMAGKDWEHTFMIEREDFAQQYLAPIYALQMYIWVLSNKLDAPGFLKAVAEKNEIAMQAYTHCRWVGDMFPDIDPLKTANYIRAMLGGGSEHIPLMTAAAAAEMMGQGDHNAIMKTYADELTEAESLGIKEVQERGMTIEDFEYGDKSGGGEPGGKPVKKKATKPTKK